MKNHFGSDIVNYHALFLGSHDALAAGPELICYTAQEAYDAFGLRPRVDQKPFLFLFGSVDSLLKSGHSVFEELNRLPFYTYINIGFESVDADTLADIGKPVTVEKVKQAFLKMLELNAAYSRIEVTGNFIAGENISPGHEESLGDLLKSADTAGKKK